MIYVPQKLIVVTPGEHSDEGPSSSERWIECPGSVNATKHIKGQDTDFSAEGSAAHALAEITRREDVPVKRYRNWTIKVGERKFPVNDEMINGVQEYLDKCDETAPIDSIGLSEVRISYDEYIPGGFGTTDDLRLHPTVCRDTDLKYGKGVQVWAKENSQLKLYGLGGYLNFRWLGYEPDIFILAAHQPRLEHYDEWEVSKKDLLDWAGDVLPKAHKEVLEGTRFKAGEWCRFCKIRGNCRVRTNSMLSVVLKDFEDLDAVENDARLAVAHIENTILSPDELALIVPALDNIRKWVKHVDLQVKASIIAGIPVGDYKLVEGRSNRKFTLPDEYVYQILSQQPQIIDPPEQLYTKKLVSPAQAETLLGKGVKGKRALAELSDNIRETGAHAKGLVHKPPGKPKLAPGGDPRDAMTHSVLEEFESLEDEDDVD